MSILPKILPIETAFQKVPATNPSFFWLPASNHTLQLDRGGHSSSIVTPNVNNLTIGGISKPGTTDFITFNSYGSGAFNTAPPFSAIVVVDIPNINNVNGQFILIGDGSIRGWGIGAGGSDWSAAGTNIVLLRNGIAWVAGPSGGFRKGTNVISVIFCNDGAYFVNNLSNGYNFSGYPFYYNPLLVPSTQIGSNSNNSYTVQAAIIWNTSVNSAQAPAQAVKDGAELTSILGSSSKNMFNPRYTEAYVGLGITATITRPDSDLVVTGWTSTAGSLTAAINEDPIDDASYITSPNNAGTVARIALTPTLPPGSYVLNIRVKDNYSGGNVVVTFTDSTGTPNYGSTTISLTGSYLTYSVPITISGGTATACNIYQTGY